MLPESDPRSGTELNRRTEGLDVRKNLSSKKEGKVFFLDIPFYRTLGFVRNLLDWGVGKTEDRDSHWCGWCLHGRESGGGFLLAGSLTSWGVAKPLPIA